LNCLVKIHFLYEIFLGFGSIFLVSSPCLFHFPILAHVFFIQWIWKGNTFSSFSQTTPDATGQENEADATLKVTTGVH
jgi:hypothetical protein